MWVFQYLDTTIQLIQTIQGLNTTWMSLSIYGLHDVYFIAPAILQGYKARNAYIATQGPLQDTVNDFWRMIWEWKSRTIVMLCETEENGVVMDYFMWSCVHFSWLLYLILGEFMSVLATEGRGAISVR